MVGVLGPTCLLLKAMPLLFCSLLFLWLKHSFNTKIKKIRSDNALELGSNSTTVYFISKGIIHQTSCVATLQQNGIVERKHKYLLETCRALIFQSKVRICYWVSAC